MRMGVLDVLERARHPLGAADILGELPAATDAVTVYRTLNTFNERQLVHRVRGEDRQWRYAIGPAQTGRQGQARAHGHPHFVCESCGTVRCVDSAEVPPKLTGKMEVGEGYSVEYAEVTLHGTCPRCH